ncbi:signal peptidase I, partial [Pseudomonas aeruginosa]
MLVLRSFLCEPFNIPSDSMVPTLETGDFILVNKFDYGVRLPIVNKKVIDIGEPKRGDVIVFRYPPQPTISYIKRVIGLPGDHIVYDHGQLIINGQKIPKVPTQFSREKDALDTPTSIYHKETIGDHTFTMRELEGVNVARQAPFINYVDNGKYANQDGLYWEVTVPKGHY